ncbi:MAG: hypothetical protein OXH79_00390 [Boseongicola sp.]|nr:hypothetical protein [Boseongicola sp.]
MHDVIDQVVHVSPEFALRPLLGGVTTSQRAAVPLFLGQRRFRPKVYRVDLPTVREETWVVGLTAVSMMQ